MNHLKCYVKDYPRPQFVRESFVLLNGEWDFRFDADNKGEREGWYRSFKSGQKINVPYPHESELSGVEPACPCDRVWYRKKSNFSCFGGKRVKLIFEGCDYFAKVWVNGQMAGTHNGGYSRFMFDITDLLASDMNAEIVVMAHDDCSAMQVRGKQSWTGEPFACWYTPVTGIWKSVWAEAAAECSLKKVEYLTSVKDSTIKIDYQIEGIAPDSYLQTVIEYGGATVCDVKSKIVRDKFSCTYSLNSEITAFKVLQWFPHAPHLYDVTFKVWSGGEVVDIVGSYFGLSDYSTHNNYITNCDFPQYLKMTLDQGYFGDGLLTAKEEELKTDVEKSKRIGLNGIRKHHKIESELFYYYCDVLGMYVWLEMPSAYEYSNSLIADFTSEWISILQDYKNHPSVMAMIPFNESWGVAQIMTNVQQQQFTAGIYQLTKALCPGKLVVSNDGWEHTQSDVVTLHNYADCGEGLKSVYGNMANAVADQKTDGYPGKFVFARNHSYSGQPLVLSEFAGIAFKKDIGGNNWGYGCMVQDEGAFLARLESLVDAVFAMPEISGFCITQTTDVMQEVNGLMDKNHEFKVAEESLRRIITKRW